VFSPLTEGHLSDVVEAVASDYVLRTVEALLSARDLDRSSLALVKTEILLEEHLEE
jgi:hypothetical protein